MTVMSISVERGSNKVAVSGEFADLQVAFPGLFIAAEQMLVELADSAFDDSSQKLLPHFGFDSSGAANRDEQKNSSTVDSQEQMQAVEFYEHFGEVLAGIKKEVSQMEYVLLAGYFAEKKSDDKTFSTGMVSSLLEENRIKVANVSESIRRHEKQRRLFRTSGGAFRLSQVGLIDIQNLLNGVE